MAEKFLSIIHQFSQRDLSEFLHKNGYGEFEEILSKGQIINGTTFLNINELQMLRWKLHPATKRKLLSFLIEVKQNPQKFLIKAQKDKFGTFTQRRQSFTRTRNDFTEKLEQVITNPKPPEPTPVKKPKPALPLPKPPDNILQDFPSSPEEYLDMNKGITEHLDDHYDESGYLVPSDKNKIVEENDYEAPPSNTTTAFFSSREIPQRAPFALPRESTDERGYIRGPEDLATFDDRKDVSVPPLFPRVQNNQRNIFARSPVNTPSPTSQLPLPKATPLDAGENEEEPVDYEPIIDEDERITPEPMNMETNTGSLSRLLGFLKKGKKLDGSNAEYNENKAKKEERDDPRKKTSDNPLGKRMVRAESMNYTARPLPPLPHSKPDGQRQELRFKPEETSETYENIKQSNEAIDHIVTSQNILSMNTLKINENVKSGKSISKSENDLVAASDESHPVYGNIEEEKKPKFPESYEQYHVKSKFGKRTLPLPPNALPQIKLDQVNSCDIYPEEESEEYGSFVCNLNDEPFYRNTDRKGARLLLYDLGDGAFLFRPSKKFFLTLSLKHHSKYFNLGIEKTEHNKIRLNTDGDMSPEFATLSEFVEHFSRDFLTFKHQGRVIEVLLSKTLPLNRF